MNRGERGRRVNPYYIEKCQIINKLRSFDGDHSLLNNFGIRAAVTIQEVIDASERLDMISEDSKKWETKENLREFLKTHHREELIQILNEICEEEGWDKEIQL